MSNSPSTSEHALNALTGVPHTPGHPHLRSNAYYSAKGLLRFAKNCSERTDASHTICESNFGLLASKTPFVNSMIVWSLRSKGLSFIPNLTV
jgi:hypothetical protein